MVVHLLDIEVRLGALVGWAHLLGAQHPASRLGGLDVEAVVADKAEDFAVAEDGVVSEHLAGGDVACLGALVGDELYKVRVACHKICVLLFIR